MITSVKCNRLNTVKWKELCYYQKGMFGSKISCQKEQKNNNKESGGGCQIFLSSMQIQARTLCFLLSCSFLEDFGVVTEWEWVFCLCVTELNAKWSPLHSRWRWRRLEVFQIRLNKPHSFLITNCSVFCSHKALTFSMSLTICGMVR